MAASQQLRRVRVWPKPITDVVQQPEQLGLLVRESRTRFEVAVSRVDITPISEVSLSLFLCKAVQETAVHGWEHVKQILDGHLYKSSLAAPCARYWPLQSLLHRPNPEQQVYQTGAVSEILQIHHLRLCSTCPQPCPAVACRHYRATT